MRLTQAQIQLVKDAVARHFGASARVWLFGSRLDDGRRGGDFDFYVETDMDDPEAIIDRKLELLAHLHATPAFEGEKIDLIIKSPPCLVPIHPSIKSPAAREYRCENPGEGTGRPRRMPAPCGGASRGTQRDRP